MLKINMSFATTHKIHPNIDNKQYRRKNVANTKKCQSRNAVNINITQMMVGKQRVKR